jgi:transcriptional regulator with XRE-family HTH domain
MRFSEAFRETMFRFRLKGIDIATQSGLTPSQISSFQHGGNLRIDSVEKILEALPKQAKEYMLFLIIKEELPYPSLVDE